MIRRLRVVWATLLDGAAIGVILAVAYILVAIANDYINGG